MWMCCLRRREVNTPTLTVPHPGMTQRNFVLIPLYELNPTVEVNGVPIADLEQSQDWSGLTRLS